MSLKVALIQMDIYYGQPERNKQKVAELVDNAIKNKPDVIILPELWTTGYDLARLNVIGDEDGEDTRLFIGNIAKTNKVNIIAGSVAKLTDNKIYNTLYAFNRDGQVVGSYSKAHLFRLMDEEKYLTAGDLIGDFCIDNIEAAGVICYDIRFPEWIRRHVIEGASILFVPAEWPSARIDHWQALLRSRAIENQCFVVAVNRVGSDPKNIFGGHSLVIDPWGNVIAEADDDETILTAEIDLSIVSQIRKEIPIFKDRRPELY